MTSRMPVPPEGVTTELARLLHGLGFSVFPVPLPQLGAQSGTPGDGKVPASGFSWQALQSTRASGAQIDRWFAHPQNVAVVTGAVSDLVVVDADSDEARQWATKRLPRTPRQVKTPRGYHLYYRHPGVPVRNRARMRTEHGQVALDVRADGGYVIGPFSQHASGERYWPIVRCDDPQGWDAPVTEVPVFDPAWLAPPSPAVTQHRGRRAQTGTAVDRARRYLASFSPPEIGDGSDATIFRVACRLVRAFALEPEVATDLLEDWAGGRPGWDRAWLTSKVAHAERYGTELMGGLL